MKSVKSPRTSKPSEARLPARKVSSSRKLAPPSSSRMLSAPRHGMSRMKKRSHSPRPPSYNTPPPMHRSHGSPDRMHSSRRPLEYEKRRIESHSPVPRMHSSRNVTDRRLYPSPGSHSHVKMRSVSPGSHYVNPPKKKIRRDVTRISPPPRGFEKSHMISGPHISHKPSSSATSFHDPNRSFPSMISRPPTYSLSERSRDGYGIPPLHKKNMPIDAAYPPTDPKRSQYLAERNKHYNLTLDERFRSVSGDLAHINHQRVQFTREDLENITIDIKRNLRDYSPTVRRIIDPSEVKLVRRQREGHRPIFDRQEIKQSPRDMREDAYNEQKLYVQTPGNRSKTGLNYKEMENYEITRHKFESNHAALSHSGNILSDKWGKLGQKSSALDRDERSHGYPSRSRSPGSFNESRRMPRPRSVDRDFRPAEHRMKPEYQPPIHKPLPVNPSDLRHNLAIRRKDGSIHDARERLMERRLGERDHSSGLHNDPHHYSDASKYPTTSHKLKERSYGSSRRIESSHESPFSRSSDKMRLKPERMSEYPHRPDRFKYPQWEEKSGVLPKPYDYYEDDREGNDSFYSRGGFRGFRGRGFRSRPFRGISSRGIGFRGRGSYRGNLSPRGKSYPPKRKSSGSY